MNDYLKPSKRLGFHPTDKSVGIHPNILITGGTGKLGSELVKIYGAKQLGSRKMNITDFKSVKRMFDKIKPELVIHSAAKTLVEQCEYDKELATEVNVAGTKNVLEASNKYNARFVYISTPAVFAGEGGPFYEDSKTSPINHYGLTKLQAEKLVINSGLDWTIIRTNFINHGRYPYTSAFTDRFSNYLFTNQVANAIKEVETSKIRGIVHVTGDKTYSMYDIAKILSPKVKKLTMKEYNGMRNLGNDLRLETKRWKKYKLKIPKKN